MITKQKAIAMKKAVRGNLIILLIWSTIIGASAQTQTKDWAVGLKVGEPLGINVRKYGDKNALDVTLGTYGGLIKSNADYRKGEYRKMGVSLNATYLWYTRFLDDAMTAYAGLGAQITKRKYYRDPLTREHTSPMGFGPSASAGLEYFIPNKTLSLFVETGFYMELLPGIGYTSPQFNIGIRQNF